MQHLFVWAIVGSVALLPATMSAQGGRIYRARLAPMPVPAFTPTVVGSGSATATLNGTTLVIAGTFEGLNTAATVARVHKGPKPGLRGTALFDLTVTGGTSGTIAGQMDLTPAQIQELAQGRYYVQLHSEKAPEGNLWGWLLSQEKK